MTLWIDALYDRAASFGRDVLVYVVAGGVFVFVASVPWLLLAPERPTLTILDGLADIFGGGSMFVAVSTTAVFLLFAIGQVMLSIGFCLSSERAACPVLPEKNTGDLARLRAAARRESLEYIDEQLSHANTANLKGIVRDRDHHLMLEIVALGRNKELHDRFIERSNTIRHVRLALGAAFISAGVVTGVACLALAALGAKDSAASGERVLLAAILTLVSLFFGGVLMHQQFRTQASFYRRVLLAYADATRATTPQERTP